VTGTRARRAALALVVVPFLLLAAAAPAGSAVAQETHRSDGHGDDWDGEDVVALGDLAARAGAPLDLTALLADDNASHWFFAANYTVVGAPGNSTLAFYFFGEDQAGSPAEPRGLGVRLPAGAALTFAIYLDLSGPLPGASELTYFDGASWKVRTLQELGLTAARNDTAGLIEFSAPRDSLLFLAAGRLAAVLFNASGTAVDAVPDLVGQPPSVSAAAAFFDYSYRPPIAFTAIGFSDPGAAEGQPVLLFLQLSNEGPKTATGVSAHVFVDGEPLGAREGLTLLPGGTAVMNFTWTARAGQHNFTATSFPGGQQATISAVFSGAAAVLVVEGARIEPATVHAGDNFRVLVTVRNLGAAPSGAAEILLKDATRVLSRASVPQLPPGGAVLASLGATYELPGTRTLRVEVDGVHTPGAAAEVEVAVQQRPVPFELPLEALALLVVAGAALAMWFLTPALLAERPGKP